MQRVINYNSQLVSSFVENQNQLKTESLRMICSFESRTLKELFRITHKPEVAPQILF